MQQSSIPGETARAAACDAAAILAADPRVQLVYLFGSAVDAQSVGVRDVDLAVLTRPAIDADEWLRIGADLAVRLRVRFDLVGLDRASIVLAHEVADHGRCLFTRTPDIETDFVIRARARYWDFKPFLDTQWRYAGERLRARRDGAAT
jgi:hypothetical protein